MGMATAGGEMAQWMQAPRLFCEVLTLGQKSIWAHRARRGKKEKFPKLSERKKAAKKVGKKRGYARFNGWQTGSQKK